MQGEADVVVRRANDDALHSEASNCCDGRCQVASYAVLVEIELSGEIIHPFTKGTVIGLDGFIWYWPNGNSIVHYVTKNVGKLEKRNVGKEKSPSLVEGGIAVRWKLSVEVV